MPKVIPTPIPDLTTPLPDPADPTTYGTRGRAMWAWETEDLVPGTNLIADQTLQNAEHAEDMANLAESVSALVGAWSSLTGPLNRPAVVTHNDDYWVLLTNLADVTTSEPGVSGDWALYERPQATQVEYDGGASGSASLTVQQALDELFIGRNMVDNVNGNRVRRREEEVGFLDDGPFAAGVFIVDRWKAGASGCTLVAASPNVAQLPLFNISAGTVVQQIYRSFQTGEQVVLGWDGGAEARINGSAWSTSPFVYTFPSAVNFPEIEFRVGTNGIARNIRMRNGSVDYGILAKDAFLPGEEYEYLARYYQRIQFGRQFFAGAAGENDLTTVGFQTMVAVPTASIVSTTTNTNVTSFSTFVTTRNHIRCLVVATAAAATSRVSLIALDTGF